MSGDTQYYTVQKALGVIPTHHPCHSAERRLCRPACVFLHHPGAAESWCPASHPLLPCGSALLPCRCHGSLCLPQLPTGGLMEVTNNRFLTGASCQRRSGTLPVVRAVVVLILDSPLTSTSCLCRVCKKDLSTHTCPNTRRKRARARACLSLPNHTPWPGPGGSWGQHGMG